MGKLKYIVFVDSNQYLIEHGANWLGFMDKIKKEINHIEELFLAKFRTLQNDIRDTKKESSNNHAALKT